MELSNYELVRYPSGQLLICRTSAGGAGVRDVVGVYASEKDAQSALDRLLAAAASRNGVQVAEAAAPHG